MSIVVTGATGQLGRLAVEALLDQGVPAEQVIASGRRTDVLADLADRGVHVRRADYSDSAALKEAFDGADRLLLVSSSEVGRRYEQHRNAIDAALAVGVELIAYTSITRADSSGLALAKEHRATEEYLHGTGARTVILRNNWYLENYTEQLPVVLQHQALLGSAGDGQVSAATRADLAAAAATAVTGDHAGAVYGLAGAPFTLAEVATVVSEESGTEVRYVDLPADEYQAALVTAGVPEPFAAVLADSDLGIARGDLLESSSDLEKLLGRRPTSLREAVRAALH